MRACDLETLAKSVMARLRGVKNEGVMGRVGKRTGSGSVAAKLIDLAGGVETPELTRPSTLPLPLPREREADGQS